MALHFRTASNPSTKVSMRFQSEDKDLLLEKAAARAVEILAPDEKPVFPDLYKASLQSSARRQAAEPSDVSCEPGFFLRGETVVWTPGTAAAGRVLVEGLCKKISKEKDESKSLTARVSDVLKSTGSEDLFRLRESALKKAAEKGLTSAESILAVDAFLKVLGEA